MVGSSYEVYSAERYPGGGAVSGHQQTCETIKPRIPTDATQGKSAKKIAHEKIDEKSTIWNGRPDTERVDILDSTTKHPLARFVNQERVLTTTKNSPCRQCSAWWRMTRCSKIPIRLVVCNRISKKKWCTKTPSQLRMKLVVHYYNPDECSSVHAQLKPICILWSNLIRIITAMSTKWGGGRERLAFVIFSEFAIQTNWKAVGLIYRHHSAFSTTKQKMVQNSKEDD